VVDIAVLEEQLRPGDEEAAALEQSLENSAFEELEELRVIAREPDAWDDVWGALMSLDRDHHDRLRAILEQCCAMSTEYISGQGGLFQVLTAEEMLDSDVAAARDDRRGAEGFVNPADARAFLELARRGGASDARDPITHAYFRALETPARDRKPQPTTAAGSGAATKHTAPAATTSDQRALDVLLQEAQVIASAPTPALPALTEGDAAKPHLVAPLFEQAMSDLRNHDPALFDARAREVGYLVNVWIAGGAHQGRCPRPVEALEKVLETCEAGLRAELASGPAPRQAALAMLAGTAADVLFRRGFPASTGTSATNLSPPPRHTGR